MIRAIPTGDIAARATAIAGAAEVAVLTAVGTVREAVVTGGAPTAAHAVVFRAVIARAAVQAAVASRAWAVGVREADAPAAGTPAAYITPRATLLLVILFAFRKVEGFPRADGGRRPR